MRRNVLLAAPFLLAVPVVFGAVIVAAGHPLQPRAIVAGAIGWLVALILRMPILVLAAGRPSGVESSVAGEATVESPPADGAPRVVVAASGPLEEGMRLVVLLVLGRDLGTALWVGTGWAGVEVLYAIVNGIALAALAERSDPEAERARRLLPPAAFSPTAPFWAIAERIYASAFHLAFTLIVAAVPFAVVVTALLHSGLNVAFLALYRRLPMWGVSLLGALAGAALVAVGLGFWGVG